MANIMGLSPMFQPEESSKKGSRKLEFFVE
jgi:hypothetical protein